MLIDILVSIKLKGSGMCSLTKTEICHFVHVIIIITRIIIKLEFSNKE